MHQRLKERLVGAAVLVVIAVIFIPMLLTGPIDSGSITKSNIPERPTEKFNSKLIPINDSLKPVVEKDESQASGGETQIVGIEKEVLLSKSDAKTTTEAKKDNNASTNIKKSPIDKIVKDKQVGLTAWVVQLGSFSSKVNADKLNLTLRKSGFPAFVEPLENKNETVYRVRVGPELLRADADALLKKIKAETKLDGIVLNYP